MNSGAFSEELGWPSENCRQPDRSLFFYVLLSLSLDLMQNYDFGVNFEV